MALLDIGAVTRTMIKAIELQVNASPVWPPMPAPAFKVSAMPPDRLPADAVACFYLYHLTEDPAFKNTPPPPGVTEIRFTPMALNLHYVLTARTGDDDAGAEKEQLIMGLAMKALRDVPVIDDSTFIGLIQVLDGGIRDAGNRVRVMLRSVPAAESVSYWTAGSSQVRLSAYYEVSVALLEPDTAPVLAGRVLTYDIQTFTTGAPLLEASQSIVSYRIPGETKDGTALARPGQVTQIGTGDVFALLGTGLTSGTAVLLLRPPGAAVPLVADAAWNLQITNQGATAQTRLTASGTAVPPGIYGAAIQISRLIPLPGGGTRTIAQTSNEVPLVIAPGIASITPPSITGVFQINGTGFTPAANVALYFGGSLAALGSGGPLAPGEYLVTSAVLIDARLPAGLPSGSRVPVRVIVSGSEAPPHWVVVP